jgi:hypothetical protein
VASSFIPRNWEYGCADTGTDARRTTTTATLNRTDEKRDMQDLHVEAGPEAAPEQPAA